MRYLGLLALILIFELINVLIHPLIIKYSHHVLITELIISVVIGSLLFPLNQALEHWMEKRMLNPKRRGRPKKGSVHKQIAPVKGDDLSAGQ